MDSSGEQSGRDQSASEVVRDGLRLLDDQDRLREIRLEEVRRKIQAGLDALDLGQGIDGGSVFEELKQRSTALRKTSKR